MGYFKVYLENENINCDFYDKNNHKKKDRYEICPFPLNQLTKSKLMKKIIYKYHKIYSEQNENEVNSC